MIHHLTPKLFTAAAVALALSACNSSSDSSPTTLKSQAIDGYVVGAKVYCDGVENGVTRTAGRFSCPAGTNLSVIKGGGQDVGFSTTATEGIPFTGVLKAPASNEFATPMTTVSVAMAQATGESDSEIDLAAFEKAQSDLASTLGLTLEAIQSDPAENINLVKKNAQINQILAAFAQSDDQYEEAAGAFAKFVTDQVNSDAGPISLSAQIRDIMPAMNANLEQLNPGSVLVKSIIELDKATDDVDTANSAIQAATDKASIVIQSEKALIDLAPVTIVRNQATVTMANAALDTTETLSLADFESDEQTGGMYNARLNPGVTDFTYDSDVFEFNDNIPPATELSVAFEVKSVNSDGRSVSFVSDDVLITANEGESDSMVISLAHQSSIKAVGTNSVGGTFNAVIESSSRTLKSDASGFTIDLNAVNQQLSDLSFEDNILSTAGSYQVTLVITGLRINERKDNDTNQAKQFSIDTGERVLTGVGFRGYVSIQP